MILCIACPAETKEDELLVALRKEFNAQYGYIAYEMPPPDSAVEFIKIAEKHN
ncbi:MAG: hypothetical protein HZA48_04740 [Planctomycetes bacterium]|nr:hypothetical protein [Planctomycetota bacterium]